MKQLIEQLQLKKTAGLLKEDVVKAYAEAQWNMDKFMEKEWQARDSARTAAVDRRSDRAPGRCRRRSSGTPRCRGTTG